MAGPMPIFTPGKSRLTAFAQRCAVEWRYSSSASACFGVTTSNRPDSVSGRERARTWPASLPPRASLASRGPMDSATARPVVPAGTSLTVPSGSVRRIFPPLSPAAGSIRFALSAEDTPNLLPFSENLHLFLLLNKKKYDVGSGRGHQETRGLVGASGLEPLTPSV